MATYDPTSINSNLTRTGPIAVTSTEALTTLQCANTALTGRTVQVLNSGAAVVGIDCTAAGTTFANKYPIAVGQYLNVTVPPGGLNMWLQTSSTASQVQLFVLAGQSGLGI